MNKKVYRPSNVTHRVAPPLIFIRDVAIAKCQNCAAQHPLSKLLPCKVFIRFGCTSNDGVRVDKQTRRITYSETKRMCFRKYEWKWLCYSCRNNEPRNRKESVR